MAGDRNREAPLLWRALGLVRRNPYLLETQLRLLYRRKLGLALDRRFRGGRSGPPVSLSLNLTRRCNLKCVMCAQHRHSPAPPEELSYYQPQRELEVGDWISLLDQAARFHPRLYVTGGEPLLYPGFDELLRAAKARRLVVHLQTNATLLERKADMLVEAGVEGLTVSLDGPAQVHDAVRGQPGVFERAARGIAALIRARRDRGRPGPILTLNCTISRHTLATLPQMADLARDLGADLLQVQHTIFNSPAKVAVHNRLLSSEWAKTHKIDLVLPSIPEGEFYESELEAEDLPRLLDALDELRRRTKNGPRLTFLPNLPRDLIQPYYTDLDYPFPQDCPTLRRTCRILPDGTVSPCLHVLAGNITREPLLDIWNGPRMQAFRRVIDRGLVPGCARCCHRGYAN